MTGLLLAPTGEARAQTTDTKLWVTGGADVDVADRVTLEAEQELRVGADSAFDQTHTQAGAQIEVKPWVRLGAHYRFIVRDAEQRHRLGADGSFVGNAGRWRFGYRLRLQGTTRPGDDTQILLRNRGKVELRATRRARPFASLELHHQLSPKGEFRELRLVLGFEWRLRKDLDLAGYYMYQEESNVGNPERNHVLGFGATYHFGG